MISKFNDWLNENETVNHTELLTSKQLEWCEKNLKHAWHVNKNGEIVCDIIAFESNNIEELPITFYEYANTLYLYELPNLKNTNGFPIRYNGIMIDNATLDLFNKMKIEDYTNISIFDVKKKDFHDINIKDCCREISINSGCEFESLNGIPSTIKSLTFYDSEIKTLKGIPKNCKNITAIGFETEDISSISENSFLYFNRTGKLKTLKGLKKQNVVQFNECGNLENIDDLLPPTKTLTINKCFSINTKEADFLKNDILKQIFMNQTLSWGDFKKAGYLDYDYDMKYLSSSSNAKHFLETKLSWKEYKEKYVSRIKTNKYGI
jgi:hypothetical protein